MQLDREGGGVDGIVVARLGRSRFYFSRSRKTGPSPLIRPLVRAGAQCTMLHTGFSRRAPYVLEIMAGTFMRVRDVCGMLDTPTCCPNAQSIECFWAHAKSDVARSFVPKRQVLTICTGLKMQPKAIETKEGSGAGPVRSQQD